MAFPRSGPILLALFCLAWSSNALVARRDHLRIRRPSCVTYPTPAAPISPIHCALRRAHNCDERIPFTLYAKDDNGEAKQKEYSGVVEDGSPLGVAIVVLGSLILINGDDALTEPGSPAMFVVFATASIAAGAARLYRYLRDKRE